jgi:glycosyltransferase involved in cell wall biosynthesis
MRNGASCMNLPRVSVVMPSFNQAAFIGEALRSVIEQDYSNKEVIVIDGGSTDGAVEVIRQNERYLKQWRSEPDRGQSDAINKGMALATGDLLTWLNSDDVLLPGALSAVAATWSRKGCCDWIAADCVWTDPSGRVIRCARGHRWSNSLAKLGLVTVSGPSSFFSRRLWMECGQLDSDLHYVMDTELWLRWARRGFRYERLDRYCWALRLHPQAKMSGHHFADSEMANQSRSDPRRIGTERRSVERRYGVTRTHALLARVLSRCVRSLGGASARSWWDWLGLRGSHVGGPPRSDVFT